MALRNCLRLLALFAAASCATGQSVTPGPDGGTGSDGGTTGGDSGAKCDGPCDQDGDGVPDTSDQCANTPKSSKVNKVGCADSQLTAKLNSAWPPYNMTWTPTGDLGRTGGLTWTYTNIDRGALFHIYWIVCDDPAEPCGLSMDGPIDVPSEKFTYSATDSDLPNGKLVFTNATTILLADSTKPAVYGRLTITIVDASNAPIPFTDVGTLGVTARDGKYGAEIKGTGFKVVAIVEAQDANNTTWTPYLDYYDKASTPDTGDAGGNVYISYGGYFYDK